MILEIKRLLWFAIAMLMGVLGTQFFLKSEFSPRNQVEKTLATTAEKETSLLDKTAALENTMAQKGHFSKKAVVAVSKTPSISEQENEEQTALLAAKYYQAGLYDLSLAKYESLIKQNKKNGAWWLGAALSLEASGERARAREYYTQVTQCDGLEIEVLQYAKSKYESMKKT